MTTPDRNTRRPASRVAVRLALLLACTAALAGCTTIKGWFGGKSNAALKPAELTEFAATAQAQRLWSVDLGDGEGLLGARQGPAVADGHVYAAALEGGVSAMDLQTGSRLWHFDTELPLSSSVGAGDGIVAVGSLEGDVVALDAATGAQKWTAKVGNEVVAAPAVGQGLVLVRSVDGRVTAFDEATGERRWFWEREAPALSVRGDAAPLLGPGFAFIGNADGTLTALSMVDGRLLWDQTVAAAEGRSELDRMADVDGTPALDETTLYASSYKKQTMAIDGPSGRSLWTHDAGGPGRPAVSADRVVVSDRDGTVWGLDKATGAALWQQAALARRNVSGVAIQGDYAVVGDYEGYLHWLRLSDGAFAARAKASGDAIRAAPVAAGDILLVQDTAGDLSAWRVAQ
jgi:outer membrane protein assembly factor BamB